MDWKDLDIIAEDIKSTSGLIDYYPVLKQLAKANKIPVKNLIVLAHQNDPFLAQIREKSELSGSRGFTKS